MQKVCLLFLISEHFDCLTPFEHAFREMGCDVEAIRIPQLWIFDREYVRKLKALIADKSRDQFVVFSPQSPELFLMEADFQVLFSAYQSWFDPERMRVIPHIWAPTTPKLSTDELRWAGKPPLRVGFMGRTYANYWLTKIVLNTPRFFKRWLLKGIFLKYPEAVGLLNKYGGFITKGINTFPRIQVLRMLDKTKSQYRDVELDIRQVGGFEGSEQELRAYKDHLERSTYIVCPRGTENYSYRMYEALAHGRIPVIIDTDMVLPKEIDWDRVLLKVPYESIEKIHDIILSDYHSKSANDFLKRQQAAFSIVSELKTMNWVKRLSTEILTDFIRDRRGRSR